MEYQEMFEAVKDARKTARNFEFFAGQLAGLLAGHLKSIGKNIPKLMFWIPSGSTTCICSTILL